MSMSTQMHDAGPRLIQAVPDRMSDVDFLHRFVAKDVLFAFLTTKLAHEDNLRSLQAAQLSLRVVVFVAVIGFLAWRVDAFLAALPSALAIVGLIVSGLLMLTAILIIVGLIVATRSLARVRLHSMTSLKEWWISHWNDRISSGEGVSDQAQRETIVLLVNLSDVVSSLEAVNRERSWWFDRLRVATLSLLVALVIPYVLGLLL